MEISQELLEDVIWNIIFILDEKAGIYYAIEERLNSSIGLFYVLSNYLSVIRWLAEIVHKCV